MFAKMCNLNPIIRKHKKNSNWGTSCYITDHTLQKCQCYKICSKIKEYPRLKETKLNAMWDWQGLLLLLLLLVLLFVCFLLGNHLYKGAQFENSICILDDGYVSVNFLILMITPDYIKRKSLILVYALEIFRGKWHHVCNFQFLSFWEAKWKVYGILWNLATFLSVWNYVKIKTYKKKTIIFTWLLLLLFIVCVSHVLYFISCSILLGLLLTHPALGEKKRVWVE